MKIVHMKCTKYVKIVYNLLYNDIDVNNNTRSRVLLVRELLQYLGFYLYLGDFSKIIIFLCLTPQNCSIWWKKHVVEGLNKIIWYLGVAHKHWNEQKRWKINNLSNISIHNVFSVIEQVLFKPLTSQYVLRVKFST